MTLFAPSHDSRNILNIGGTAAHSPFPYKWKSPCMTVLPKATWCPHNLHSKLWGMYDFGLMIELRRWSLCIITLNVELG